MWKRQTKRELNTFKLISCGCLCWRVLVSLFVSRSPVKKYLNKSKSSKFIPISVLCVVYTHKHLQKTTNQCFTAVWAFIIRLRSHLKQTKTLLFACAYHHHQKEQEKSRFQRIALDFGLVENFACLSKLLVDNSASVSILSLFLVLKCIFLLGNSHLTKKISLTFSELIIFLRLNFRRMKVCRIEL